MADTTILQVQIKKTVTNTVLQRQLPVNKELHYKIYNSNETLVFSKSIIIVNAEKKMLEDLDISHLPPGKYELQISSGTQNIETIHLTI